MENLGLTLVAWKSETPCHNLNIPQISCTPTRHTLPTWNRRSALKFQKKALSRAFEANSKRKKGRDREGKDGECKTKQQRRRDACWGHVGWITNVSNPKNQALQISLTQKDFENRRAGKMKSWCQAHWGGWQLDVCLIGNAGNKELKTASLSFMEGTKNLVDFS